MQLIFNRWILLSLFFVTIITLFVLIPAKGIPILAYHMVSDYQGDGKEFAVLPKEFDEQMSYLHEKGYKTILVKDLVKMIKEGRELPKKTIAITFDDGYVDNYTEALPILQKYGYVATVYMISSYVGEEGFLNEVQLKKMVAEGWEIGSHTKDHVMLGAIPLADSQRELSESKRELEKVLENPVVTLAYPFGSHTNELCKMLKKEGYSGACIGDPGLNSLNTNVYQLKRNSIIRSDWGMMEFRLRIWRAVLVEKHQWLMNFFKKSAR